MTPPPENPNTQKMDDPRVGPDRIGIKHDSDKVRLDLIPVHPLLALGRVYTIGARKYADRDWEAGISYSRIYAAMLRHALAFWSGEDLDREDGQQHLASVAWCAFALMEYQHKFGPATHLDDRPRMKNDLPDFYTTKETLERLERNELQ